DFLVTATGALEPSSMFGTLYFGPNNPGGGVADEAATAAEAAALPLEGTEREQAYIDFSTHLAENPVALEICVRPITYIHYAWVGGLEDQTYARAQGLHDIRYLYVLEH